MSAAEEEARAVAFRAQQSRRAAYAQALRGRAGPASSAAEVRDAWRPWTDPQPDAVEPCDVEIPRTNAD